jgi:hypothetical protein
MPAVVSPLLSRQEAAAFLGVKPQTLHAWACNRRYKLPFVKVGAKAMYKIADLERFIESRTVDVGGEDQ